jgi:class 3 adenylate cyclase
MSQGLISSEQIRSAIAGLEAQRALLGDAVVEPALYALRQQLATLAEHAPALNLAQDRRLVTIFFSDVVGSVTLSSWILKTGGR